MKTLLAIYGMVILVLTAAVLFLWLNHHSTDPALYFFARDENEVDAIKFAAEVGRLDVVSILLGGLGIVAAFVFLSWMGLIRLEAKEAVRQIAVEEAEARLKEFVDEKAPLVVQRYLDLVGNNKEIGNDAADEIARHSGDENGKRA